MSMVVATYLSEPPPVFLRTIVLPGALAHGESDNSAS